MALVQDDHVVQAFAAETPDEPLDIRILPWTPGSDEHFFDPHMPHPPPKGGTIDAVSVSQKIPWRLVPGEGVHHLLCGPCCCGMRSDGNMEDPSAVMSHDQQDEQDVARHGGHDKPIPG